MKTIVKVMIALIVTTSAVRAEAQTKQNLEAFYKYLGRNTKYPINAADNSTQGYSMVTFQIVKGTLGNVTIAESLGDDCDVEVVSKVLSYKEFKDFKDGNYALKVKFSLADSENATIKNVSIQPPKGFKSLDEIVIVGYRPQQKTGALKNRQKGSFLSITTSPTGSAQPLVILDDKEVAYAKINEINPNTIESIEVFKDSNAVAKYGPQGINGVVVVTSKKEGRVNVIGYGNKVSSGSELAGRLSNIVVKENGEAKKEPLYKLNGNAITSDEMKALNPNTIESITVLKDASATALHGAEAINGVVLIVTKKDKLKE